MTTIFERVSSALSTVSPLVPFSVAPYLSADGSLPDVFISYQLITSNPEQHADNAETSRSSLVQINLFARAGFVSMPNVLPAMTLAGFQRSAVRQLPKQDSGHFGLAEDYVYHEGV
jgi:hypothetical protein